ncbi:unnamed protein product, partial [Rotaria magnacalcarata]
MCWPKGVAHRSVILGGNGGRGQSNQFKNLIGWFIIRSTR